MSSKNSYIHSIGDLWNSGNGASEKLTIKTDRKLGENVKLANDLEATIKLIRGDESIIAIIEKIIAPVIIQCPKCLNDKRHLIEVIAGEREFLMNSPERDYDPFENFIVDKKDMSIDLSDLIRQEIILHFPINPVCSDRCKGLCEGCGIDLNVSKKHSEDCQAINALSTDTKENRPFANLKNIINNS
ncbi:hypothetical protein GF376_00705 [Candidatus Peregrinibacteria bacterium]|nr:hypothetical protein [Candidatus Peregrinibacteria bacterium]